MNTGRINERNTGSYTLDGELKRRRQKVDRKMSASDNEIARAVLYKVFEAMEFDREMSDRGHLHPDAVFTDGGRITLSMTRAQYEQLSNIVLNKL